MTPLERRAAMRAAVTLRQITMNEAARELGVSYNHLTLVLLGNRQGSIRLEEAVAAFFGRPRHEVFPSGEFLADRK